MKAANTEAVTANLEGKFAANSTGMSPKLAWKLQSRQEQLSAAPPASQFL